MNSRKKTREVGATLDPDDIIHPPEVSKLTSLKNGTLASLRRKDEGPPYYKLSYRNVVYSRSGVLAWIAERRVTPGAVRVRAPK